MENEPAGQITISPAIPGRWIHSREEDVTDIEVYRRFFDFPSFPRDAFELLRDHTFILEEVDSSGDVVAEQARGHFQQPADDRLTVSFGDGIHAGFTFQAIELSQDLSLLRVRRLTGPGQRTTVQYQLTDPEFKLRIVLIADPSGSVEQLTFAADGSDDRVFSGAEISTVATSESIRATIVLDARTETTPEVTFEVTVPVVLVGPEPPEHGPFGVFAAGLRTEHFSTPDAPSATPGPLQAVTPIALTGRAIAH